MASHRLEFGFVDFLDNKGKAGSLYFLRTSQGRGKAILRLVEELGSVRITAPTSFVRAADQIADASQVLRVWAMSNRNVRGECVARRWTVKVGSGDVVADGKVYPGFESPHELVHGVTVCMTFDWLLGKVVAPLEHEPDNGVKTGLGSHTPVRGFETSTFVQRGFEELVGS